MFGQFVSQVQRLFSSKKNGGKLIHSTTNRLHGYKQVLLAICIVFLLGYSQFREHFQCAAADGIDKKQMTNFCWANGTSTVLTKKQPPKQAYLKSNGGKQVHQNQSFQDLRTPIVSISASLLSLCLNERVSSS